MECRTCSESLTAFMDGELSRPQAKEVESHLTECTQCNQEYQSLFDSYQLVERASLLELTQDLWPRIHSQITISDSKRPSWIFSLRSFLGVRWIPITAGTLGVAFLSLFFVYQRNIETEQALHAYLQERERFELIQVRVSQDTSSPELQPVYPNPFMVFHRNPRGNPFKLE